MTSNYTVFLIASYLPWLLFQEAVMRSSTVLVENCEPDHEDCFPIRDPARLPSFSPRC